MTIPASSIAPLNALERVKWKLGWLSYYQSELKRRQALCAFESATDGDAARLMLRHNERIASYRASNDCFGNAIGYVFIAMLISAWIAIPVIVSTASGQWSWERLNRLYLAELVGVIAAGLLIAVYYWLADKLHGTAPALKKFRELYDLFLGGIAFWFFDSSKDGGLGDWVRPEYLRLALLGMMALFFVLPGCIYLIRSFWVANYYRFSRSHPDSAIVERLVDAYAVGAEPEHLFDDTNRVLLHIEGAARLVETVLARRFRTRDYGTDAWYRNQLRQVAQAIRALKRVIVSAPFERKKRINSDLESFIKWAACNRWDEFRKVDEVTPGRVWHRLLRVAAGFVVATTPLLVVLAAERWLIEVPKDVLMYALLGSALWLLVNAFGIVDPRFEAKLGMLGKMKNALSGSE